MTHKVPNPPLKIKHVRVITSHCFIFDEHIYPCHSLDRCWFSSYLFPERAWSERRRQSIGFKSRYVSLVATGSDYKNIPVFTADIFFRQVSYFHLWKRMASMSCMKLITLSCLSNVAQKVLFNLVSNCMSYIDGFSQTAISFWVCFDTE